MAEILYRYIVEDKNGYKYENIDTHVSKFLGYITTIPPKEKSDGATGARDLGAKEKGWRKWWSLVVSRLLRTISKIKTDAWFVHDNHCKNGCFDCGTKIPNILASFILSYNLWVDGYKVEAVLWFLPTFIKGGGKCRENGMFWVKK